MSTASRTFRRSAGIFAALVLSLGTIAGLTAPARAGDVTPGPIGTRTGFEFSNLVLVQTVSGGNGKLVPSDQDKTLKVYDSARLSLDWKAPSPAKKGMSFSIALPAEFRGTAGTLDLEYTTCTIEASGTSLACVLNDKAEGLQLVSGHLDLELDVKATTSQKNAVFRIDGTEVRVDLPGPNGIDPEGKRPTGTTKQGWQITSDMVNRPNAVGWRIYFSGKKSYDIVDAGIDDNSYISWWCVEGVSALESDGRYGDGGANRKGDLNITKISDGTSLSAVNPMRRAQSLREGVRIVPPNDGKEYACAIDILEWDALTAGGVAIDKTENTATINGARYGVEVQRKQSGAGSDQGYPYPHIDIVKKDSAGNDANTDAVELTGANLDARGVGSTDLAFTIKNDSSVENLKQVVVTDATTGSGKVESMACTFPGENSPTAGVYDEASKKWTVRWAASFGDSPQLLKTGVSFPCTARLTGVTADQAHADTATVTGVGVDTGTVVNDEDPYKAKVPAPPTVDVEKTDGAGNDADTAAESVMLPEGSTKLSFTVTNASQEDEKNVVVKDVVAKGGKVKNLECAFPDGSKAADPAGARVRWENSFAATRPGDGKASGRSDRFAPGASFKCTAELSDVPIRQGDSGSTHEDTATVEVDGAISGLHASDADPYNAHRPPEPAVSIVKKDVRGNDADARNDAVALTNGETDLVFDVTNPGPEPLREVVVSDATSTASGKVTNMRCSFPGENAPTAGVYDEASKKWTVRWEASFGRDAKTLPVGGSFGCTAHLEGVSKTVHTDTAAVDGKGAVTMLGVHDENPYNALPPEPGISVEKRDGAGNAADTLDAAPVLPRGQAELAFTVSNTGADPLSEVSVVDETTGDSGRVESMACTFPGENGPTAGVYDEASKKWTVEWRASFGQAPKTFAVGASFPCSAKLTGVTEKPHADEVTASGTGALSGKGVSDKNPYHAKPPSPKVSIVKKDAEGNDGDDSRDPVQLGSGTADLVFTVSNPGTEDLKKVVVSDVTSTASGRVESMACTFPGENGPTAGVYDEASKKWTVKWDASWKDEDPSAFPAGSSIPCTAKLTGVTDKLHTDTSKVDAVGYGSGTPVEDENPYNAAPPKPDVSIDKSDSSGNGGNVLAEAPVLDAGQTDLTFRIVNDGGEALREVVVSDVTSTASGRVESMACTFPGENSPTAGVYDEASKKWTVEWRASFGQAPKTFAVSDSFTCSARLTGVKKTFHTDVATFSGLGAVSAKGVTRHDPYNALPKDPNVTIVKKDSQARDADTREDAAILTPDQGGRGSVDLDFAVANDGGEALREVVVSDVTSTASGRVESMACTFPGENSPTAGVYDEASKKWTVKWDASWKDGDPSSLAIGASFGCTAHLSGVTGDVHADAAKIDGVGIRSGKPVSAENPYHARVPSKPSVDIEKVDGEGNDADTDKESVLLPKGEASLVFTIVNDGNESLRAVEVTDEATGSGEVEDLVCTFPDGSKGTRWEASFAQKDPARLGVGESFACTARLVGVTAGGKHADTAKVVGVATVSGTGVSDEDGYHGHRDPEPTPTPTPSTAEPTPPSTTPPPTAKPTAKPKPTPAPKLPRTGADARTLLLLALGLAGVGSAAVAVRRRGKA